MSIFKPCDIRGRYPEELDEPLFRRIGLATAGLVRREGGSAIVVGADVRPSSPGLKDALVWGLRHGGLEVVDLGVVPTPVLYFAFRHQPVQAAAMVTASHNPAEYNGLKLCVNRRPITPDLLRELAGRVDTAVPAAHPGGRRRLDVWPDYLAWLRGTVDRPLPGGVVIDAGGGGYAGIATRVFAEGGCRTIGLFDTVDGRFQGRPPNPAVAANLAALADAVPRHGAALGIAFDGDGDRVAFVDDRGRVVDPDAASRLLLEDVCPWRQAPHHRAVVYDLKCSERLREAILARGCRPIMERSGHTFIKTRMIDERAAFGAELSGHYFYDALEGGDDGLYTALRMAQLVAGLERPLSAAVDALPRYCLTPDIRLSCEPARAAAVVEAIGRQAGPEWTVDRTDGIRLACANGWGLARPSVTESAITLRFEGHTPEALHQIMERFSQWLPDFADAIQAQRQRS